MIFYLDSPWTPDPGYSMYLYFNQKSYVDYSNYKNDRVDQLITEGLETLDAKIRMEKYKEVQKILMDEARGILGLSQIYPGAEGEPEGVHLLHLEQPALPGLQSRVIDRCTAWRVRRPAKGQRVLPTLLTSGTTGSR